MSDLRREVREAAGRLLGEACRRAAEEGLLPAGAVLRGSAVFTGDEARGELRANHALRSASALRISPRALAQMLAERLALEGSWFRAAAAAGPGFLNFYLSDAWYAAVLAAVRAGDGAAARGAALRLSAAGVLPSAADQARRQDRENPVYAARYAHARLCTLLSDLETAGHPAPETAEIPLLAAPAERALIRALSALPETVRPAEGEADPGRAAACLAALTGRTYDFLAACRLRETTGPLLEARLLLADCARRGLALSLGLFGLDAPREGRDL